MADFENRVNNAADAKEIPGCVLTATDRDGTFQYARAFGKTSSNPEKAKTMELNNVMLIASATKFLTSVCAMQVVDRGFVTLDEPVYKYIPELKSFKVFKGWTEAGEPIEEPHKQPITLRRLLSHTSGLAYDFFDPRMVALNMYYKQSQGSGRTILERFKGPLVFEPGESWAYSSGIDYAGLLVERVTNQKLDEFMKANLWEPLGIKDMTFFPAQRPDMMARMVEVSERDDETGKVRPAPALRVNQDENGNHVLDCMGGQGVYMAANEYIKVLKGILDCDKNSEGKILSKAAVDELFKPQLNEAGKKAMAELLRIPMMNNNLGGLPYEIPKDHGLGGVILMGDSTHKKAGTMAWGGYPNLVWWVDRKAGFAGIYSQQMMPLGDEKVSAMQRDFSQTMYERLEKQRGESKL